MEVLKHLNLALRFALELCMLAALAYGGYSLSVPMWLKVALAIALPVIAATIWGLFIAPKAKFPLNAGWRIVLETALFGVACLLLAVFHHAYLAIGLAVLVVINEVLLWRWKQSIKE